MQAACSGTWNGVKEEVLRNAEHAGQGVERGWDKTKETVQRGGNAVGRSISNVGDRLQEAAMPNDAQ